MRNRFAAGPCPSMKYNAPYICYELQFGYLASLNANPHEGCRYVIGGHSQLPQLDTLHSRRV